MTQLTEKKARFLRRFLYLLLLATLCYVSIPMVVSAFRAVDEGTVLDPFTGQPLSKDKPAGVNNNCVGNELDK